MNGIIAFYKFFMVCMVSIPPMTLVFAVVWYLRVNKASQVKYAEVDKSTQV